MPTSNSNVRRQSAHAPQAGVGQEEQRSVVRSSRPSKIMRNPPPTTTQNSSRTGRDRRRQSKRMQNPNWFNRAKLRLREEERDMRSSLQQHAVEQHSWKKLIDLEEKRREIVHRKNTTLVGSLMYWNGTVLNALCYMPFFYFLVLLYVSLRFCIHYVENDDILLETFASADITLLGGFLSFFLTMYVSEANNRFHSMYGKSRDCQAAIMDLANLSRRTLPKEMSLRLNRYMNAAHVAGYVGLSLTYDDENFFRPHNQSKSLLTPSEVARVRTIDMDDGSAAYHEILAWAIDIVMMAHFELRLLDNPLANMFREKIFKFRDAMGALFDYNDQPVPFFYINFVSLLSFLYLPLFTAQIALATPGSISGNDDDRPSREIGNRTVRLLAFSTDMTEYHWVAEITSALLVLFQAVYILGLRYIANRLAEPYGDDVEDLSVLSYVNEAWEDSRRLLAAEPQSIPTLEEELEFANQALESIGRPWSGKGHLRSTRLHHAKNHEYYHEDTTNSNNNHQINNNESSYHYMEKTSFARNDTQQTADINDEFFTDEDADFITDQLDV